MSKKSDRKLQIRLDPDNIVLLDRLTKASPFRLSRSQLANAVIAACAEEFTGLQKTNTQRSD